MTKRASQPPTAHPEQPHGDAHGPDLLRQIDICRRFGISDETLRRWRKRGRFPLPIDAPGAPRWHREDVDAFLARHRAELKTRRFFRTANARVA